MKTRKGSPVRVGYARVSTAGQVAEGVSLEAQKKLLLERGATVIHEDAGVSGTKTKNRPGLAKALAAVEGRPGSSLIVYSLSRLARSTADALAIAKRLEEGGVALVSLSESIDTGTAMGRCFYTVLAAIAALEADIASERTRMGLAHLRSKGRRISGRIPYGFDLEGDAGLVENVPEQKTLGLIRRLSDEGLSLAEIASRLRERGITTKTGSRSWSPSTLSGILRRLT